MASRVLMPQAGQSMTEGRIVRWLVPEGARVRRGDPLLEIETDKANMEVEAAADGVLRKVLYQEGEVVPVLTTVAVIAAPDEPLDLSGVEAVPSPPQSGGGTVPSPPQSGEETGTAPSGRPGRLSASPLARRLAHRQGIDLRRLKGSGPRGRIVRRDVDAAVSKAAPPAPGPGISRGPAAAESVFRFSTGEYPPPSPRPPARVPLTGMRKAIALALQHSIAKAPHYYATVEIDVTALFEARRSSEREGLAVSVNDLLIRAAAIALSDEPKVNCRVYDDAIEYPTDANIGIAVGLEEGLVVPVVMRAQARSLADITAESRRIIDLAREGKLVGTGQGTFTISNLGMFGVKCFTAVINPPEGAILAVGAQAERLVPMDGGFFPRRILEVTLSADHRAIDGLLGARFLMRLKRLLEEPARIF